MYLPISVSIIAYFYSYVGISKDILSKIFLKLLLQVQFQIVFFNPTNFTENGAKQEAENAR